MPTFDFIAGDDFRSSLVDDYRELESSLAAHAWKAAHVLAGSIVEAVLVDYLVSTNYRKSDPLEMNLYSAARACKDEKVISESTAELTNVVRHYRNMIHPGRMKRLGETATEETAFIAKSLVDIVLREVKKNKYTRHGYTADQIVQKITNDPGSVAVISKLIADAVDVEIEKLLNRDLERLFESSVGSYEYSVAESSALAYQIAFRHANDSIKKKTCKKFVKILKEGNAGTVREYENNFFHGSHVEFMDEDDAGLVARHMIESIRTRPSVELLNACLGMGGALRGHDALSMAQAIGRVLRGGHGADVEDSVVALGVNLLQDMEPIAQDAFRRSIEGVRRKANTDDAKDAFVSRKLGLILGEPEDLDELPF